jgi:hypothetical protein
LLPGLVPAFRRRSTGHFSINFDIADAVSDGSAAVNLRRNRLWINNLGGGGGRVALSERAANKFRGLKKSELL